LIPFFVYSHLLIHLPRQVLRLFSPSIGHVFVLLEFCIVRLEFGANEGRALRRRLGELLHSLFGRFLGFLYPLQRLIRLVTVCLEFANFPLYLRNLLCLTKRG
jgi:hypothetical protein